MNEKKGFSSLSDLTSEVNPVSETKTNQAHVTDREKNRIEPEPASRNLPGEGDQFEDTKPVKTSSSGFFTGLMKLLLAIPWQVYLVGGVAGYFYYQHVAEDNTLEKFQGKISYYLTRSIDSNSVPQLVPGILPIDLGTKTVDRMFFRLKDNFKPKSADDVSSVVGFKCSDKLAGSYSDGASGYQKSCDIYVIDVRNHSWAYAGNFTGTEPPDSKKGGGSRTGSHPAKDYLRKAGVM